MYQFHCHTKSTAKLLYAVGRGPELQFYLASACSLADIVPSLLKS